MANIILVGKRLIPREHIAFIEPFDPNANPKFSVNRPFQSRVMMVNRDSILIEGPPAAFAKEHGFRMLKDDHVATNPAVHFSVEMFTAVDGFVPNRPYLTRLLWRDLDGNEQSKLLMTEPETVLAVVVHGEMPTDTENKPDQPRKSGKAIKYDRKLAS